MVNHRVSPPPIRCGRFSIGPGRPCFVIGEAGVNHNGDPALAERLIDVAAAAGVDAVKFQTFRAGALVSAGAPKAEYQKLTTQPGESQGEMLRRLELSAETHQHLRQHCRDRGILFLSTPFDPASASYLVELGVPALKVGSGEVTNLPFLRHLARLGKPVLMSTGMSYLGEVEQAVRALRQSGCEQIALLHCVSSYPADPADANLRAIETLRRAFGLPVGFSDHTLGLEVPLAAVALGACLLEKHFTLDRDLPGPDHRASLEPDELGALVRGVRSVEAALGDGRKRPARSELETRSVARRSLAAAVDIAAGSTLTSEALTALRPGIGISPALLDQVAGRRLRRRRRAGELIAWGDLQ